MEMLFPLLVAALEVFNRYVMDMLKTIPVENLQHCYQKWEKCLHLCVPAQGNYFDGDNIDVWKNKNFVHHHLPRSDNETEYHEKSAMLQI